MSDTRCPGDIGTFLDDNGDERCYCMRCGCVGGWGDITEHVPVLDIDLTEFEWWDFSAPLTATAEIQCLDCKVFSPVTAWEVGTVGCEDCGEHGAMVCPECGERFDHVYCREVFEVRR